MSLCIYVFCRGSKLGLLVLLYNEVDSFIHSFMVYAGSWLVTIRLAADQLQSSVFLFLLTQKQQKVTVVFLLFVLYQTLFSFAI